jgi:hypothetical protein
MAEVRFSALVRLCSAITDRSSIALRGIRIPLRQRNVAVAVGERQCRPFRQTSFLF